LTLHFIPPQTPTEKILATIWSQVLGLEVVGIYDNFFELGGDSIKAIQVVSRLAQQNLQLKEKHLFQYPTIAELAQEVVFTNQKAEQKLISGIVPLTPIQSWFFLTYAGEKHHFNQSLMLATLGRQNVDALHQVVRQIQIHHDALRLRFKYVNDRVVQECGDADHPFSFEIVDLVGRVNAIAQLEAEANQVQASMDLEHGPLIRFVLFHLDQGDRLLMVAHHLVIDGLSWRILLEDISTGYKQACVGSKIKFPSKTDSYQRWSTELQKYSTSHQFQEEQKYWQQLANTVVDELIIDFPEAENLVCDNCTLTFCLTPEQTDSLLKQVHGSYNTEINDILLASLAQAMNAWCGGQRFLIDLEGHGRISDIDTVDVSRTVGWFTTIYPVLIELVSNTVTEYQIKFIKEMLRRIPLQGIGYGILRYLTQPQSDLIHIQPSILFNYLGRIDEDISLSMFDLAEESCGDLINSQSKRTHELEFSGIVHARQLRFSVTFSARRFKQQTIQKLLDCYQEALQGIIEHCQQHTTPVITPSDLTYNNLSLEEFDEIFADE
jgi:surfactin family lipopeptide synthetase A